MRSKEIISEALNKQDMVYNGGGIFASYGRRQDRASILSIVVLNPVKLNASD